MAEETKPAENAPAPTTKPATGTDTKPAGNAPAPTTKPATGDKPAEGGETKPAEGGDKPADSGSQIKDASLEFMSHQCGVLVIMKGGHMVDSAATDKVDQLSADCEAPGSAPTDTSGSTSTDSSSSTSSDTSSSDTSSSTETPKNDKKTEPRPKELKCGLNLTNFPIKVFGDTVAATYWNNKPSKRGAFISYTKLNSFAGLKSSLMNNTSLKDHMIVISPMMWASDAMSMGMAKYWNELLAIVKNVLDPKGRVKAAGLVILGLNPWAHSSWDAKTLKRNKNAAYWQRAYDYGNGKRANLINKAPSYTGNRLFMAGNIEEKTPNQNNFQNDPHRVPNSYFTGTGPYAKWYGPVLKEYSSSLCNFKVGGK